MARSLAAAAFLTLVFGARPARACDCGPANAPRPGLDEAWANATVIFLGQVVSISKYNGGDTPLDPLKVTFKVVRDFKGAFADGDTLPTPQAPGSCLFEFQVGGTYLVYASAASHDLTASLCSRTRKYEKDDLETRWLARAWESATGICKLLCLDEAGAGQKPGGQSCRCPSHIAGKLADGTLIPDFVPGPAAPEMIAPAKAPTSP